MTTCSTHFQWRISAGHPIIAMPSRPLSLLPFPRRRWCPSLTHFIVDRDLGTADSLRLVKDKIYVG